MTGERSAELVASDGVRLRALTSRPPGASRGFVLCHPHPDFGGSMHVPVLDLLAAQAAAAGHASVRFDFRKPGTEAERLLDLAAAIDAMAPLDDLLAIGWSYGADLALATAATDERLRVVAIAPPLRFAQPPSSLDGRARFVVPEHDQFNPPDAFAAKLPWAHADVVAGADHFLAGAEARVAEMCMRLADDLSAASQGGTDDL